MRKKRYRIALLVSLALTALAAGASSGAFAASNPGASSALADQVRATLGSPTELFVNCPAKNTVPLEDGSLGQLCEFRAVLNNAVVTGSAVAKPVNGTWQISDYFQSNPMLNEWRRCGRSAVGGRSEGARTQSVSVHGYACSGGLPLHAGDLRFIARKHKFRLPRSFDLWEHGTNTIGFVVFSFSCDARTFRHKKGVFGVFRATCATAFGDAFVYRFRMAAPKPKHQGGGGGGGHGGGGGGGGNNCTPGYSPCIPPGPDVDCAGGGGNGPRYVQGPVTVTGSDPYGLDANNDGVGCET